MTTLLNNQESMPQGYYNVEPHFNSVLVCNKYSRSMIDEVLSLLWENIIISYVITCTAKDSVSVYPHPALPCIMTKTHAFLRYFIQYTRATP